MVNLQVKCIYAMKFQCENIIPNGEFYHDSLFTIIPISQILKINCINKHIKIFSQILKAMQGKKIGIYHTVKVLGRGGYGTVYKALTDDKQIFALKYIEHTQQQIQYVKKEAQRHKDLNHPNILKMHKYFCDSNSKFQLAIIFEYCAKKDLAKCLQNKDFLSSLDRKKCIEILTKITEGLIYLHQEKNLIHRDIKPENIMMTEDHLPKIGDLGNAKNIETSNLSSNNKGTFIYLAPELCQKKEGIRTYDFKIDIWSFGIVALELLLGRKSLTFVQPFLPASMQKDFPSEGLLEGIQDKALRKIVKKMLIKDPNNRWTSRQVLNSLYEISGRSLEMKSPVNLKHLLKRQNSQLSNTEQTMKKMNKCFVGLHKAITLQKMTLQQVFNGFANKKSGKIGYKEFASLITAFDQTLSIKDIEAAFNLIDADGSELIDFDELNKHYSIVNGLKYSKESEKSKQVIQLKFQERKNIKKIQYKSKQQMQMLKKLLF